MKSKIILTLAAITILITATAYADNVSLLPPVSEDISAGEENMRKVLANSYYGSGANSVDP